MAHALLLCLEINRIWFASNLGGHINVSKNGSFVEWLVGACMQGGIWISQG